jgi:hypothetical protein
MTQGLILIVLISITLIVIHHDVDSFSKKTN